MQIFELEKVHQEDNNSLFLGHKTKKQILFLTKPPSLHKSLPLHHQKSNISDISLNEHTPINKTKPTSNNNTNHSSPFVLTSLISQEEQSEYIIPYTKEQLDNKYNLSETLEVYNYEMQLKRKDYSSHLTSMNPRNRWILFDWIMEICNLLHFNRETYHLSVMIFDMYLSKIKTLAFSEIQLIGVTCMFIAAKNEEYHNPPVEFFAQSTKFTYISRDILECEKRILKKMNWKIQTLTLNFWSNYIIYKWDIFNSSKQNNIISFKTKPILFIQYFGIIDVISMDYYNIFKDPKIICGCVLYLLIGLYMKVFTIEDIKLKYSNNEIEFDSDVNYNMYMISFLSNEYGMELNVFNEYICYVSDFFVQKLFDDAKERILSLQGRNFITQDYSLVKMAILEKVRKQT